MQGSPLPTLGFEEESIKWRRLRDGTEHARSQLVSVREGLFATLKQENDMLVALVIELAPLGWVRPLALLVPM
jgi:hypothetical protein